MNGPGRSALENGLVQLRHAGNQPLDARGEQRGRLQLVAALEPDHPSHQRLLERARAQAVDRVGRQDDRLAGSQRGDGRLYAPRHPSTIRGVPARSSVTPTAW